jgi:hypothetical protein
MKVRDGLTIINVPMALVKEKVSKECNDKIGKLLTEKKVFIVKIKYNREIIAKHIGDVSNCYLVIMEWQPTENPLFIFRNDYTKPKEPSKPIIVEPIIVEPIIVEPIIVEPIIVYKQRMYEKYTTYPVQSRKSLLERFKKNKHEKLNVRRSKSVIKKRPDEESQRKVRRNKSIGRIKY